MLLKRLLTHSFVAVFAESVISAAVVTIYIHLKLTMSDLCTDHVIGTKVR